ncbi:MAG TPA: hybrid sensor histidine kinase/response regulator [Kofleriaceae bacterium]|jgi:signal transduction histidine kinase|nr:hybrid sensor histidine kinase/response regulator [Kofleriaceae bacterium]
MKPEPIKILLVDDTPENLVALEALVRRDGVQVLAARSGGEALELLLVHEVALALLDVQMPEMDGFELAELMRGAERTKHVPIIFVTAGTRDPSRVFKGYETGAVDFLFKPLDPHILKSKVDVFLELADQRRQLTQALRLYEMFVAILGHDLRNPLGALTAGTELLATQLADPRQLRTLGRMTAAGRRMTAMIEQLLDLTRARLGGGIGFLRVREALDIRELVQRTVDELHASHPERDIALTAASDCTTSGDPGRLLQLFGNLVANAIAHGLPGTPVAVNVIGGRRDIVVEVRNAGVIPPDRLATLFEPFQGRPQHAVRSAGLGLGLFIAREIAAAHGGDITVESSEPRGTAVTVRLPRNLDDLGRVTRESGESPVILDPTAGRRGPAGDASEPPGSGRSMQQRAHMAPDAASS